MRNLKANLSPVYYKKLIGQEEIIDQWGNATGNFTPLYSELKTAMLSISPNKGNTEREQFGTLADYDRTMTTADTTIDIDEDSILWLDGKSVIEPHNFIVKKRAPWKNSVQFAIKEVNVSNANN